MKYLLTIITLLTITTSVYSAGYATDVPSLSAMGNSYAGQVTGTHNIANQFINPATLTEFDGAQFQVDSNYILLDIDVKKANGQNFLGSSVDVVGDGSNGENGGKDALVPQIYFMHQIYKLRLGLGITVPFGLGTYYNDSWVGRYHAIDSEIKTLNISPVVAFKVNDLISIGGGLQFQYMDASISSAVDFGTVLTGTPNLALDGKAEVSGDDWGYGYKFGVLIHPTNNTKIGLSYRSKIEHRLKGENDFTVPNHAGVAGLMAATGRFIDTDVKTKIITPASVNFGVAHKFNKIELLADAAWTDWSQMNKLVIKHDNPLEPTDTTNMKWNDSWMYSLGANYHLNEKLALRSGIGYEETAVSSQYMNPRLPIPDKYLVSVGVGYKHSERLTFDASYVYEFLDDAKSNLTLDDSNNTFRGSLNTEYDVSIQALGLSMNYSF